MAGEHRQANEYKVCVCDEALLWSFRIEARTVRFRVHAGDEGTLPLPDTAAFHAACARALGLSGAADYMDLCDDEAEDLRVLAADGSSGGLLLDKLNNSIVPSP